MKVGNVENGARARWLVGLAVAGLGWFLLRQLSLEWAINPQYSYGWVVPILSLYLVAERWRDRPDPGPSTRRVYFFWTLAFLVVPLRLAQEANPDWRLTSWLAALATVGLLWLGFAFAGGRAWWRHFAFATAFILTAAPWPTPLENAFVQSLMQWVASVAVEFLNWCGLAAAQSGNLIHLPTGTLGIDEACSGVRSFQATVMVALFLGELHRLNAARRLALLLGGSLFVLILNLARAIALALLAAQSGLAVAERWHDPAGYILLALDFAGLYLGAKFLRRRDNLIPASPAFGVWPRHQAIAILSTLLIAEVATAAWYRSHEIGATAQPRWIANWNRDETIRPIRLAENIRLVLRFNEGHAGVWNRPDGSRWHLYFFSWKPGRAAAQLARNHRPETCLPATGFEFVQNRGLKMIPAAGLELPVERLEFKQGGQRWQVYYCLWEDRAAKPSARPQILTRASRLWAIAEGRRHLGQRVFEAVIQGLDSPEQADAEFEKALAQWIQTK